MAKEIAIQYNADPEMMFEGQEKKHFWAELGGKKPYFNELLSKQSENVQPPRLFQITWAGQISVEEIGEFGQDDLIAEDVMLLDVTHTIFLWFGALSNKYEQQEGVRIAKDYLESCPNERDGDTPIIIIKQVKKFDFKPQTFLFLFLLRALSLQTLVDTLVPGRRTGGMLRRSMLRQLLLLRSPSPKLSQMASPLMASPTVGAAWPTAS